MPNEINRLRRMAANIKLSKSRRIFDQYKNGFISFLASCIGLSWPKIISRYCPFKRTLSLFTAVPPCDTYSIYFLHCIDNRMHCINDNLETLGTKNSSLRPLITHKACDFKLQLDDCNAKKFNLSDIWNARLLYSTVAKTENMLQLSINAKEPSRDVYSIPSRLK